MHVIQGTSGTTRPTTSYYKETPLHHKNNSTRIELAANLPTRVKTERGGRIVIVSEITGEVVPKECMTEPIAIKLYRTMRTLGPRFSAFHRHLCGDCIVLRPRACLYPALHGCRYVVHFLLQTVAPCVV